MSRSCWPFRPPPLPKRAAPAAPPPRAEVSANRCLVLSALGPAVCASTPPDPCFRRTSPARVVLRRVVRVALLRSGLRRLADESRQQRDRVDRSPLLVDGREHAARARVRAGAAGDGRPQGLLLADKHRLQR